MNRSESKHGFYLLFHTPCLDQVLFPTSTDYIFNNKSSITLPLAQWWQASWAASSLCLCSPPGDLGFEHLLGITGSSNHSSRDVSPLASQVWPNLWLTPMFGTPRCGPTHPGFILAHHGATHLHFIFSLYICICVCVCVCVCFMVKQIVHWKVHMERHTDKPRESCPTSLQSFNIHLLVPWSFSQLFKFLNSTDLCPIAKKGKLTLCRKIPACVNN